MKIGMIAKSVAAVLCIVSASAGAERLAVGVGSSDKEDAKAAGAAAAKLAREALGGSPATVVVVFAARRQVNADLVAGVAESFDSAIVYGGEGYSPVTAAGNFASQGHDIKNGVAVLAIGGNVKATAASETVAEGGDGKAAFAECGRKIGEQLKPALAEPAAGRIIVTFGNQHVGDNQPYVEGLSAVTGTNTVIVGAASGGRGAKEIVKGAVVSGVNVAILLTGEFKVGVGLEGGQGNLVDKTETSLRAAVSAGGGKPVVALIFDCGGRRGGLVKEQKITEEFEVMKRLAGPAPIFGFYGGGEIGQSACGAAARGVGFSVAAAVLSVE
jgi:hypothetical protein